MTDKVLDALLKEAMKLSERGYWIHRARLSPEVWDTVQQCAVQRGVVMHEVGEYLRNCLNGGRVFIDEELEGVRFDIDVTEPYHTDNLYLIHKREELVPPSCREVP